MASTVIERLNERRHAAGELGEDAGFTLIELMVVLLILATGLLVSVLSTFGRFGAALIRRPATMQQSVGDGATTARPGMLHGQTLVRGGSYIARPGDTVWVVARSMQPTGDLTRLVQVLKQELLEMRNDLVSEQVMCIDHEFDTYVFNNIS